MRYDKIIQDGLGGLKLVDLPARDYVQKLAWVARSLQSSNPEPLPIFYMLPISNSLIWYCNISSSDLKNFNQNLVSVQVWKAWAEINSMTLINATDVLDQVLWYNHFIKWGSRF